MTTHKNKFLPYYVFVFLCFVIASCQPVKLENVVFDNNLLSKININAEKKIINKVYEINYLDPYIDNTVNPTAIERLNNWLDENLIVFGTENKLIINILEASLTKIERNVENKKLFNEKTEFYYEMKFKVEYILYDDNDFILSTTEANTKRSTTSSKYLSLYEKEKVANELILESLEDISLKSFEMLKLHMAKFLL